MSVSDATGPDVCPGRLSLSAGDAKRVSLPCTCGYGTKGS